MDYFGIWELSLNTSIYKIAKPSKYLWEHFVYGTTHKHELFRKMHNYHNAIYYVLGMQSWKKKNQQHAQKNKEQKTF